VSVGVIDNVEEVEAVGFTAEEAGQEEVSVE
jgi:hypothetical protein